MALNGGSLIAEHIGRMTSVATVQSVGCEIQATQEISHLRFLTCPLGTSLPEQRTHIIIITFVIIIRGSLYRLGKYGTLSRKEPLIIISFIAQNLHNRQRYTVVHGQLEVSVCTCSDLCSISSAL